MSAADIEARRADAIRAMDNAKGYQPESAAIEAEPNDRWPVIVAIGVVGAYQGSASVRALHALALLLAAMTEPQ